MSKPNDLSGSPAIQSAELILAGFEGFLLSDDRAV